ncbi:MAG: biopolymer transporter ExbD [Candidatus Aminicenantes bacterium]|nr:biopolymer transporter ExbD [Candidatus Aminicenantes bacterium]
MGFTVGEKKKGDVNAEPNVVPLCDVLLVLLIIFMVVTPLIQKGVDLKLPQAANTIEMPDNPEVVLYIKKDGTLFVNEDQVNERNPLQILLEDALMQASDKKLYLKADQELEFGQIVDIIGTMKNAGVEDIGIITDKKTEQIK